MVHPSNTDVVMDSCLNIAIERNVKNNSFCEESQSTLGETSTLEEVNNASDQVGLQGVQVSCT